MESSRVPGDGANDGTCFNYSRCMEESDHPDIDSRVLCDAKQYLSKLRMDSKSPMAAAASATVYPTWATSLDDLIDDPKGIDLFQTYLETEKCDTRYLQLLLACRGIKAHNQVNNKEKLIRAIFRKLIKGLPHISAETKQRIADKIGSGTGLDEVIFAEVEREAKEHMCKSTYPNFIKSDMYLDYMQQSSLPQSGSTSPPDPSSGLVALPEESELPAHPKLSEKSLNHHNYLMNKMKIGPYHSKRPPEKTFTNCHANYNPYLPASAIESDRQSVSSGGRTDSMLSLSTLGGMSSYKPHSKKMLHKDEMEALAFIPRTQKVLNPNHNLAEKDCMKFADLLCRKLEAVLREREVEERMRQALHNCSAGESSESDVSSKLGRIPPQLLSAAISDRGRDSSEAEAILDQHCSRVWSNLAWTPPPRSPPYLTPHPPSPPPQQHYFHQHIHHHRTPLHRPPSMDGPTESRHPNSTNPHSLRSKLMSAKAAAAKVPEDQRKSPEDVTIIGYQFAGQSVPYRAKFEGKQITLGQFKNLLPKKGNFRYFFKSSSNDFENCGVVLVEVEDDDEILPLWENKIYAEITTKS